MSNNNPDGGTPPKCSNTQTPAVTCGKTTYGADENIVIDQCDSNNRNSRNEEVVGECENASKEDKPSPATSSYQHFDSSEQDLVNNIENLQALRDQLNNYSTNHSYNKAAALYQASLIANIDSDHDKTGNSIIMNAGNSENDSTIEEHRNPPL